MKTIKKISHNFYFLMTLSFSVIFMSCNVESYEGPEEKSLHEFSGEQIFAGIFFSSGDVSKLIPEASVNKGIMEQMNEQEKTKLKDFETQMITYLKTRKNFSFQEFKTGIVSKDHRKIERTLISTQKEINSFVKFFFNLDNNQLQAYKKIADDYLDHKGKSDEVHIEEIENYFQSQSKNEIEQGEELLVVVAVVAVLAVWAWAYVYQVEMNDGNLQKNSMQSEDLINSIVLRS